MDLPTIGSRVDYTGFHGTVKYVGEVINSSGIWLGIEWDDPQRGKHDGVKDGVRYFHCLVPGTASFLRPSAKIAFNRSFLDALSSKYIEAPHGSGSKETVILGSSDGTIEVEAVGLDKIRTKLADLGQLREVSLDKENVSRSDPPGAILNMCPNIRGLDLSDCLIPTWDVLAQITSELPKLERLSLNRTRLALQTDMARLKDAFNNVVELQLNRTMTIWSDMMTVTSLMPHLQTVEMAYNRLSQLDTTDELASRSTIQSVNLEGNFCSDWNHLCNRFKLFPSLQRIVLTYTGLKLIPFPTGSRYPVGVKHLALSANKLKEWSDIDALASWCTNLESLNLGGNPLANEKNFRPITIARIPSLKVLDGSPVSQKERDDCELFYLSHITQNASKRPSELAREHPRWHELRLKHGQSELSTDQRAMPVKLREHIITLNIYVAASVTLIGQLKNFSYETLSHITLKVLPSMTLRLLRAKVSKVVKNRAAVRVMLWQQMKDGVLAELGTELDTRDLSWLGLEEGTAVVCAFDA
ncbi:hypothetical protein M378DRAFT_1050127 [Amanita muscaria Koide BX008]|uniref:U2 small nuclear ribonucleoprotein A' n=1 Tax=Amanita muscaria (strain Koide BX008) TaxID=946122 RepID=A0A0C2X685_AMAMK|nr:hypothetical protein M378DRAFT_1050127 [Amanita muscaria Koide BX008]